MYYSVEVNKVKSISGTASCIQELEFRKKGLFVTLYFLYRAL